MKNLSRFDAALRTFRRFLREISRKIGDVAEMEIGAAKGAVSVAVEHVFG